MEEDAIVSLISSFISALNEGLSFTADPNRECPDDNKCEQLCSLEVDGESGLAEDPFNITCSCLNGYNLDENKANCTGMFRLQNYDILFYIERY